MSYKLYPQETVLANSDPKQFKNYDDTFKDYTRYSNKRVEEKHNKQNIKSILDRGTPLTPEFVELVKNIAPDYYEQAQRSPIFNPNNFQSQIKSPAAQERYKNITALLPSTYGLKNFTHIVKRNDQPVTLEENEDFLDDSLYVPPQPPSKELAPLEPPKALGATLPPKELGATLPPKELGATLPPKELAPQAVNDNKELDNEITLLKIAEVKEQMKKFKERDLKLKETDPVLTRPVDIDVVTDAVGLPPRFESPVTVKKELEAEVRRSPLTVADPPRIGTFTTVEAELEAEVRRSPLTVADPADTFPNVPVPNDPVPNDRVANDLVPNDPVPNVPDPNVPVQFAVGSNKEEHPAKYHKRSVTFYLGSPAVYDTELSADVYEAGMSKQDIINGIDSIIEEYGNKIFVYGRIGGSIDEFHELIQVQFCIMRNLQRGSRSKMAMVPISSLVDFANKLSGTQAQAPDTGAALAVADDPNGAASAESVQVQVTPNQAIDNVVEAFRNRPFDTFGKPIINKGIASINKQNFNILGPNNKQDPANLFKKAFEIKTTQIKK